MRGNTTAKRINVLFSYALNDIYDNYFYTLRLQLDGNLDKKDASNPGH